MQIPPEWVAPILSITGMIGSLCIFVATRIVAQRERSNIAKQVALYRQTQLENRLIDVIDEAHNHIQRIQTELNYYITEKSSSGSARATAGYNIRAENRPLYRLSYRCGDFGHEIRDVCKSIGGFIKQKTMPFDIASSVIKEVASLEIKMTEWLNRVLTEGLQNHLSD